MESNSEAVMFPKESEIPTSNQFKGVLNVRNLEC